MLEIPCFLAFRIDMTKIHIAYPFSSLSRTDKKGNPRENQIVLCVVRLPCHRRVVPKGEADEVCHDSVGGSASSDRRHAVGWYAAHIVLGRRTQTAYH